MGRRDDKMNLNLNFSQRYKFLPYVYVKPGLIDNYKVTEGVLPSDYTRLTFFTCHACHDRTASSVSIDVMLLPRIT